MTHFFGSSRSLLPATSSTLAILLSLPGLFEVRGKAGDAEVEAQGRFKQKPDFQAAAPELSAYSDLWNRSVFTSKAPPAPEPSSESQPAGWISEFQLSGWVRLNGRLTVYLTRLSNQETIILNEDEEALQEVPRLLDFSGEDTILDARAKVALNGESGWIALNPDASQQITIPVQAKTPEGISALDASSKNTVVEPTTVDSRAAKLTGPVLLDAAATYQTLISPAEASPADTYQRLQDRRDKLIRAFPRIPEP